MSCSHPADRIVYAARVVTVEQRQFTVTADGDLSLSGDIDSEEYEQQLGTFFVCYLCGETLSLRDLRERGFAIREDFDVV